MIDQTHLDAAFAASIYSDKLKDAARIADVVYAAFGIRLAPLQVEVLWAAYYEHNGDGWLRAAPTNIIEAVEWFVEKYAPEGVLT